MSEYTPVTYILRYYPDDFYVLSRKLKGSADRKTHHILRLPTIDKVTPTKIALIEKLNFPTQY